MVDLINVATRPVYRFPPEAYFSPEWHERERTRLFARSWTFVGHQSNLPEPGDYLTAWVGGEPVVVVRREDGALGAHLNICRHRGMVVALGEGHCGSALRCMYHGWEWSLDGALQRVPQRRAQFGDIEAGELGLHPASVATWAGFVFVHPQPEPAVPFEAWLGEFPAHCGDYPWSELVEVDRRHYNLACNWKLFIENHIDWLHLWYLHDITTGAYEHTEGVYGHVGVNWYSAERLRESEAVYKPAGLIPPPGLSTEERRTVRANLLFPNTPFITTGNSVMTFQVRPSAPETSELELRIYGMPGSTVDEETWGLLELIVLSEDARACEQMQMAMHSERFAVGPLAVEHERPIEEFHEHLEAALLQ
jgi:phenylpropionate dioxygenase-like ring-hydroxylating dioxygenase large terminal subunit